MKAKSEIINKVFNCKGKCGCYNSCMISVLNASNSDEGLKLVDYATRCANKNVESK